MTGLACRTFPAGRVKKAIISLMKIPESDRCFGKHGRKRAKEISEWATSRERGDNYHMNPDNDWHKQMDAFEDWFRQNCRRN